MSAAELPAAGQSPNDPATLWQRTCERLATELPEQQFNTWIRPLPPAEVSQAEGTTLVSVRVANRFMLDWIRTQYSARLEVILRDLQAGEIRLELALAPRMAAPAGRPAPRHGHARSRPALQRPVGWGLAGAHRPGSGRQPGPGGRGLSTGLGACTHPSRTTSGHGPQSGADL